jgi:hypothetical protein
LLHCREAERWLDLGSTRMKKQKQKNSSRRKVRPSPEMNTRGNIVYIPPLSENAPKDRILMSS